MQLPKEFQPGKTTAARQPLGLPQQSRFPAVFRLGKTEFTPEICVSILSTPPTQSDQITAAQPAFAGIKRYHRPSTPGAAYSHRKNR